MLGDNEATIMTMYNAERTEADECGLVAAVATVVGEKDVRVVEESVFTALEQITNPRLMEQWDPDPCPSEDLMAESAGAPSVEQAEPKAGAARPAKAADYGVKVEAHYNVGEYDIAVLS